MRSCTWRSWSCRGKSEHNTQNVGCILPVSIYALVLLLGSIYLIEAIAVNEREKRGVEVAARALRCIAGLSVCTMVTCGEARKLACKLARFKAG